MWRRGIGAALLRRQVFRDVSKEPEAILHALGIVVFVAISHGLGLMDIVIGETTHSFDVAALGERALNMWILIMGASAGWVIWSSIAYVLGSKFLRGGASFRSVLRVMGVSHSPGTLLLLMPIPVIGVGFAYLASLWVLVASVVAVHEIQDIDWVGATLSTIGGWFIFFLIIPGLIGSP